MEDFKMKKVKKIYIKNSTIKTISANSTSNHSKK